jgi:hypothetical protein
MHEFVERIPSDSEMREKGVSVPQIVLSKPTDPVILSKPPKWKKKKAYRDVAL